MPITTMVNSEDFVLSTKAGNASAYNAAQYDLIVKQKASVKQIISGYKLTDAGEKAQLDNELSSQRFIKDRRAEWEKMSARIEGFISTLEIGRGIIEDIVKYVAVIQSFAKDSEKAQASKDITTSVAQLDRMMAQEKAEQNIQSSMETPRTLIISPEFSRQIQLKGRITGVNNVNHALEGIQYDLAFDSFVAAQAGPPPVAANKANIAANTRAFSFDDIATYLTLTPAGIDNTNAAEVTMAKECHDSYVAALASVLQDVTGRVSDVIQNYTNAIQEMALDRAVARDKITQSESLVAESFESDGIKLMEELGVNSSKNQVITMIKNLDAQKYIADINQAMQNLRQSAGAA